MSTLQQKALCALQQYELIRQGDRVAVGVSGGADSVALLRFLSSLTEYRLQLVVCHVNHGLRGEESDRDQRFVEELAASLSLPCMVQRIDAAALAAEWNCSVEEAGRRSRYRFFAETAGESGLIATAHTLDDSIETVLLNMIRGTGLHGLCGIPRRRGNIIRPLLDCTRTEVEDYLQALGQPYVTDSSNLTDDYTRNRIRHRILPEMTALNPNLYEAMSRMTAQLSEQRQMTDAMAEAAAQQFSADGAWKREALLSLPKPVADRVLLQLLEQHGIPRSAATLQRMRQVIQNGGTLDVGERRWFFAAQGDTVQLLHCPQEDIPPKELPSLVPNESLVLALGAYKKAKLTLCNNFDAKEAEKFNISPLKYGVDCDKIKGNCILRTRQAGDALQLPKKPLRKINDLWQQAGIPALLRDRLLVFADGDGPLWVEGLGTAERAALTKETKNCVIIEVTEEQYNENG